MENYDVEKQQQDTVYWETEREKQTEENQEGEFVTGYVLKTPKTPRDWIRRWAIQTSCNGIPNIQRTKSPVRLIVWVIIVLAGTVLTVMSIVQSTQSFLSYPINVVVTAESAAYLPFPAITICNINPVRKSKLYLGGEEFKRELEPENDNITNPLDFLYNRTVRTEVREQFDNRYALLDATVRRHMGHQLQDMLIECNYEGRHCDLQNFTLLQSAYYGNCYSINTVRAGVAPLRTHKAGSRHGMSLEFYMQQEEYVPALTTSLGMRIAIHRRDAMPFPEDGGLLIAPGFKTMISLQMEEIQRLPSPYPSKCLDNEREEAKKLSVYSEIHDVNYTQQACRKTCVQRFLIANCGCADPTKPMQGVALGNGNPGQKSSVPCLTEQQEECEENVKYISNTQGLNCQCHNPCWQQLYYPSTSMARWPNDNLQKSYINAIEQMPSAPQNIPPDFDARMNIARVEIYFEDMMTSKVEEQKAYTFNNLYSDLGGNIGFYLGMSIVGLFEIFELLVDLIRSGCYSLKNRLRGKSKQQQAAKTPTTRL